MRFGSTSEFGAIDLLGSLAVNAVGTRAAAKKADFRVGIAINDKKTGQKSVPAYLDYRFLGGAVAAVIGQTVGRNRAYAGRVAHDAASGLLNSFVATESMRSVCMAAGAPAEQIPASASPNMLGAGADPQMAHESAVAGNYAYGW
jgi:hypothetical protein